MLSMKCASTGEKTRNTIVYCKKKNKDTFTEYVLSFYISKYSTKQSHTCPRVKQQKQNVNKINCQYSKDSDVNINCMKLEISYTYLPTCMVFSHH